MSPKNPNHTYPEIQNPFPQSEHTGKAQQSPELQNQFSADRKVLKKNKAEEKLARDFNERVVLSSSARRENSSKNTIAAPSKIEGKVEDYNSGRERLKRHRVEVAGRVWIPEMWGQESFLKDWIDCTSAFDSALRNNTIMSAREAMMEEGKRANSNRFRIEKSC